MAAPKGNQFWRNIDPKNIGRNPKFETPEELWNAAVEYFQHCDDNPIETKETFTDPAKSTVKIHQLAVPYTWEGLYVFLGICNLNHYKTKEAFSTIITHIGNVIRNQKFSGAASGIFNANIIARDLGLTDKKDITSDGEQLKESKTVIKFK